MSQRTELHECLAALLRVVDTMDATIKADAPGAYECGYLNADERAAIDAARKLVGARIVAQKRAEYARKARTSSTTGRRDEP